MQRVEQSSIQLLRRHLRLKAIEVLPADQTAQRHLTAAQESEEQQADRVLTRQRGLSLESRCAGAAYTGDLLLQTLLSEPVFEPDLSELRGVVRNQRPLSQTRSVIKRIRIGDNLTRVTECAQATANEFIETEFLRATDLNHAVHRRSD